MRALPLRVHVFEHRAVRYALVVGVVIVISLLRKLLEPFTGTGAPFVLYFGAVLVCTLFAGPRAGILAALLGTPIAAYEFVVRAGFSPSQAAIQGTLFVVDCAILVYLSALTSHAREAAESAEARLRLANESAAIGCWEVDVTTRRMHWSPDLAFPGGGPTSLDRWSSLVHPDDRDAFERAQAHSLDPAGDGTFDVEVRLVRPDGSAPWFSWSGRTHYVKTAAGRIPKKQIGIAVDVTERRERVDALTRMTEEVARSASHVRDLLELAPDAIFLADREDRYTEVNRAACRMLGYERDELVGKTIRDLIPAEDAARLAVHLAGLPGPGQVSTSEWKLRRKDGTLVPVEVSANRLADGRAQAVVRDITERRRIEAERQELLMREQAARRDAEATSARLKESEDRFRLTIDEAPIGMALVSLDGHFVRVNRALCEIVGYTADELERLTFQDITHPDDLATDVALAGQLARAEIPRYQLEKRYIRKDGKSVPIMLSGSAMRASDQKTPLYFIAQIEDITVRKRAEEALQESEREFRLLAESMPQIVWATTADGLNTYFNQQWVDYTGLTHDESHGEGWIRPFHPDDRQRAWDAWQRATRHHESYSQECRMRRADGVYRWWLIRGVPVLDENGVIQKWFGTCTDIEDIKRAEQRIRESEAKYSGIVAISADAIISVDREQRITIFNDGAEKIFGYTPAEVIGTPLGRLIPARLRDAHRRHVEEFASGKPSARQMGDRFATIAGLRKNGEEFPAEAAISKLQVGDTPLMTVSLRDISERVRVEKEQRFLAEAGAALASSLDYEQTLATVARLVVRDFADWCVVEVVEHQQLRRLKVVSADPSKADICALLEGFPIERTRPYLLSSAVETKRPFLIELVTPEQLESLAQGPVHLEVLRAMQPRSLMALPLLRHEQLLGAVAFVSSAPTRHYGPVDVRLAEALAERAAVAIENARLYNAAVEATELRDQVLGFVAHDLRNPLHIIMMQADDLLHRNGPVPEPHEAGQMIERAATRMNRLIEDILDVSRMEAGHLSVEQARVSAEQLVVDSVHGQQHLATAKSIDLEMAVGTVLPEVWADRDRVLQVFENLIANAMKFTKPGGRITAGAAAHNGDVLFWVKDTGAGISAHELPHVFDRFWQAKKTGRAGAGLGLQIVKGIVEAHGGHIWLDSRVGVGTTVYFTLPTARRAAGQDD